MTDSLRGKLRTLHAKYHDMPGNLYGRDDCGWERCEFWDVATFLDAEQDETADQSVMSTLTPADRDRIDAEGGRFNRASMFACVEQIVAEHVAAAEAERDRLRAGLQQLIDHSWAQYEASDYSELVSLGDVAKRLTALLDGDAS